MALHEQPGQTDEWYTPRYIFDALGCEFDLDVAHPGIDKVNWIPARHFLTSKSLQTPWRGFIYMNPPFGPRNGIEPWLERFVEHGNGIALTPDRTSAPWWQRWACRMDLILFVSPKIRFIGVDGKPGVSPAQGTCLMGLGKQACSALHRAAPILGVLMVTSTPISPPASPHPPQTT